MSSGVLAFIFGLGVGTWVYTKMARANGNPDPKSNLLIAGIAGAIGILFIYSLLNMVLHI